MSAADALGVRLAALECEGPWRPALEDLVAATSAPGTLSATVCELGLAVTFAARGDDAGARRHGERAVAGRLTRPQAIEALVTAALHSGWGVLERTLWIAEAAVPAPWDGMGSAPQGTTEAIVAYFEEAFGGLPRWLEMLAEHAPDALDAYYRLRFDALGSGALRRQDKELILVIMNCAEHYELGMRLHMRTALAAGADRVELIDAIRCSMVAGGMVAWVAGMEILAEFET